MACLPVLKSPPGLSRTQLQKIAARGPRFRSVTVGFLSGNSGLAKREIGHLGARLERSLGQQKMRNLLLQKIEISPIFKNGDISYLKKWRHLLYPGATTWERGLREVLGGDCIIVITMPSA